MPLLSLQDIVKDFSGNLANDHITFDVPEASIFGLLGPNGAGKTTLIRIITRIIEADSGSIYFNGEKLNNRHKAQIGYMPEERGLYKKMKVGEHLIYLARLKNLSKKDARQKIDFWMENFNIQGWWNKKIEELSKGMQQKIQFISTVLHEPALLILDEPFSGLDPINTNLIKEEIFRLKENGATILFSTHRMEQVEEICERIVLINNGKLILQGEVSELKQRFKEHKFRIEHEAGKKPDLPKEFEIIQSNDGSLIVQSRNDNPNNLLRSLLNQGIEIHSFNEILPGINEIFIKQVKAL